MIKATPGLGKIQDIQMYSDDHFTEYTKILGNDVIGIKDKYALWQGIVGEIKTRKGELQGVDTEDYGCDIWKFLGRNITKVFRDQIELCIKELVPKYEEVSDIEVLSIKDTRDGYVKLNLLVKSNLGDVDGDVILG